jgi:hypothetical protein
MAEAAASALASLSLEQPADRVACGVPAAWLQRLVNDKQLMQPRELSALMAASWEMCEAVLRVMDGRWLAIEVGTGSHAGS